MREDKGHGCGVTGCLLLAILAGLAGGVTEIVWVSVYSVLTPISSVEVARQIAATVLPALSDSAYGSTMGVVIHLLLSVILAVFFVLIVLRPVLRQFDSWNITLLSLAALTLVWAVNFLIILPVINPGFITIMPGVVTLISKLLFGFTMGVILNSDRRHLSGV